MKWSLGKIVEVRPMPGSPYLQAEVVSHHGERDAPVVRVVERDPVWHGAELSRNCGAKIREVEKQ